MWAKLGLYFHTLRYLRWPQLYYRIWYMLRGRWRSRTGFQYNLQPSSPAPQILQLKASIAAYPSFSAPANFHFLNLSQSFADSIDWNFPDHGKLWTYNLNYFEFLHQPNLNPEEGLRLMRDFIAQAPQAKDGLEPFPTSLRIIFWVRFLAQHQVQDRHIDQSLYAQLGILQDKLEYHLLGNHLLENAFALLFGAYYFGEKKVFKKAEKLLQKELKEQILSDGGHFELSPMYHQLMLYRVLDCINLVQHNPSIHAADSLKKLLEKKAGQMLAWLQQMSFSSGAIPLFNDSARGIAPTSAQLFDYAARLALSIPALPLRTSGYRRFQDENYECILDVGAIGPDYIPGHAHSDSLGFELYLKDHPFLVDTGTSTYEKNAQRTAERSTAAHNTVQIGDADQSEVWGGFRVARRARTRIQTETKQEIVATHDGYKRIGATHERTFQFAPKQIVITDRITGQNLPSQQAFLHFHPDVKIKLEGQTILTEKATITIKGAQKITQEAYAYAPQFNTTFQSTKIIVNFTSQLTLIFGL